VHERSTFFPAPLGAPLQNIEFENKVKFGFLVPSGRHDALNRVKFGVEEHNIGSLLHSNVGRHPVLFTFGQMSGFLPPERRRVAPINVTKIA